MRVQSLASLSGLRIWHCIAANCGLCHRCGSDLAPLWLWCWPAAPAPVRHGCGLGGRKVEVLSDLIYNGRDHVLSCFANLIDENQSLIIFSLIIPEPPFLFTQNKNLTSKCFQQNSFLCFFFFLWTSVFTLGTFLLLHLQIDISAGIHHLF